MTAELALTRPDPTLSMDTLRVQMEAAKRFVDSGLLPQEVKTPQQALVIMQAGRELGVPATYALRNIHVVKGKPTCSAELMLALVRRTYGPSAIRVAKTSNTACTVQYREQGWDGISEYTFTIEDARAAGVAGSTTWKAYPAAMLRARCISAVVRFAFPECISGLYTPDELGAEVSVTDDGSVIDVRAASSRPTVVDFPAPEREVCDIAHFNAYWHAAVKGTRFEQDDIRHKFVAWYTNNEFESLTAFLEQATHDEAAALIVAIRSRIDHEARQAREKAIAALNDAVARAASVGANFPIPDDLDAEPLERIEEMTATIESALNVQELPA